MEAAIFAGLSILWLAGAAAAGPCPAPRFEVQPLIVADDGRDRGYPGGLSLGDVDNDGDLDLLATRGYDVTAKPYKGDRSLLYINDGRGDFSRREAPFGDYDTPDSGATLADVDGDGDLDAYIGVQHKKPNHFFRNHGGGRFAAEALGDATADRSSDFSSIFADIDGDGDLDLYTSGPTLERGGPNLAFRNDDGRFVAVVGTPIDNGSRNPGASLWADVDSDGDLDLFVANSDILRLSKLPPADIEHGVLYRNEGGWRFSTPGGLAFADPAYPVLTAAFGDVDNDGDLDLFAGSYVYESAPRPDWLFLNDGRGRFALARQGFPAHATLSTGAAFADFNADGSLDLLTTSYEGPIALYAGDGAGGFSAVADAELAKPRKGLWSVVTGDIDGDGRVDALLGSWGETPEGDYVTILRNRTPSCGAWAQLVLADRAGAHDPPGARVTFVTANGRRTLRQTRESTAQSGFRSQSASAFLFAIPPGHRFRRAEIRWPDGRRTELKRIGKNDAVRVPYSP